MRAWIAHPPFSLDSITMLDCAIPAPVAGTILVRMYAVALNLRDVLAAMTIGQTTD